MRYSMAGHHRRHYPEEPETEVTMKTSNIPNAVKTWGSAFLVLVAVVTTLLVWASYLHTDAEAFVHIQDFESYQEQQLKSDKFDRVDRVEREIVRLDYQLLDTELAKEKRDYLTRTRADLVEKIKCIRDGTC